MTRLSISLFLILSAFLFGKELPWIGVSFERPSVADRQSAKLGEEMGLKVRQIVKSGPLSKAGGQIGDLWWKMDGQILINNSQLFILLQSKKVGDPAVIELFRNGKLENVRLTLGSRPSSQMELIATNIKPGSISRKLESSRISAVLTTPGDEKLSLTRVDSGWHLRVEKGAEMLFDDEIKASEIVTKLEPRWQDPFMVLQLTLAQRAPVIPKADRKPRRRYIPNSTQTEESN